MTYNPESVVVTINGETLQGMKDIPEIRDFRQKSSDSFMSYTAYIKAELGRILTTKEYETACQYYIHGKNVDLCVDKLKKGE